MLNDEKWILEIIGLSLFGKNIINDLEENEKMFFRDVAEYEINDSELAKRTISNLHYEIYKLKQTLKETQNRNKKMIDYVVRTKEIKKEELEFITKYERDLLDILRGDDDK